MEKMGFQNVFEEQLLMNQEAVRDLTENGAPRFAIDEVKQRVVRLATLVNLFSGTLTSKATKKRGCGFVKGYF